MRRSTLASRGAQTRQRRSKVKRFRCSASCPSSITPGANDSAARSDIRWSTSKTPKGKKTTLTTAAIMASLTSCFIPTTTSCLAVSFSGEGARTSAMALPRTIIESSSRSDTTSQSYSVSERSGDKRQRAQPRRNHMKASTVRVKALMAVLIAASFVSIPLPALGQKTSPVAPTREQVEAVVREAYDKFRSDTTGKNADYIPYLAQVDSKLFGVAVVTTDNRTFSLGDVDYSFSIQSISKVFTLALAMEELGADKVFMRVGSEPTGRPFNSVNAVVDMATPTGNPLVNAGAIATTSLISGSNADEKWNKILGFYSRVAGEKLTLIEDVYKSEAATNAGNKALSMLLAKYERIYADPFE